MKQVLFYFSILFIIILSAVSCSKDRHWIKGDGDNVTNTRTSSSFTGIILSISADVELYEDSIFRIELNGQQNILDVIETKVKGNNLCIGIERFTTIRKHNPILIRIYLPKIENIDVSGSGNVKCKSFFQNSIMNCNVSGSGSIDLSGAFTESFTANISGSGDINMGSTGNCKTGKYTISGSGSINADWFKVDNLESSISGSGDQRVYAVKTLDAKISGSGMVYYRGNPVINSNISGSGKIKSLQ
jgi:hypothetical protein